MLPTVPFEENIFLFYQGLSHPAFSPFPCNIYCVSSLVTLSPPAVRIFYVGKKGWTGKRKAPQPNPTTISSPPRSISPPLCLAFMHHTGGGGNKNLLCSKYIFLEKDLNDLNVFTEAWFTIIFVLAAFHDLFRFNGTIPYPRNIIKEPIGIIILPLGGIGERRGGNNIVRSMERGGYTTRIIPQLGSTFYSIHSVLISLVVRTGNPPPIRTRQSVFYYTCTTYTGTQQQKRRLFFHLTLWPPMLAKNRGAQPKRNSFAYYSKSSFSFMRCFGIF